MVDRMTPQLPTPDGHAGGLRKNREEKDGKIRLKAGWHKFHLDFFQVLTGLMICYLSSCEWHRKGATGWLCLCCRSTAVIASPHRRVLGQFG